MLQIASALAISGLLVGVVSINRWYRAARADRPLLPVVDDLNVW